MTHYTLVKSTLFDGEPYRIRARSVIVIGLRSNLAAEKSLPLRGTIHILYIREENGDPYGIRTRVAGVKGQCPRPLDEGVAK